MVIRIFALILTIIILPFLLLIGLVVFLSTKGFPLFAQKRAITLEGRVFYIYKFRTMKKHTKQYPSGSIFYKPELEREVTRFGLFLRKTGLDEILQLINIVKGDMSFIGPRPLSVEDLEIMKKDFPEIYSSRARINLKPGITGYWQILGDRKSGMEDLLLNDLYYFKNRSLKLNLKILALTIKTIVTRTHSDSIISTQDKISVNKSVPAR